MIRALELFRSYRADPRQTLADLREALDRGRDGRPGGVKPADFGLRDLAATFITTADGEPIGHAALERLCRSEGPLLEADGALTPSAFATITGQIVNVAVMEGYQLPEYVLSAAVPTINGSAEIARFTGVSLPLQEGKDVVVRPGQEYPSVGLYDEYVRSAETTKRGAIVRVTKETVLQDSGGQILDQARRVGELIGGLKETRLTDYVIGAVTGCVLERRIGDAAETARDLFYAAAPAPYVNQQVNPLVDWTDVDAAENRFLGVAMPGTTAAPQLTQRVALAPPQLRSTASRILTATETRTNPAANVVVAGNPLAGLGVRLLSSPQVYTRLVAAGVAAATAAGTWFYGDLARAFRYYQNWGLTVEQDSSGSLAFSHDVIAQFKASEKGVPVVVEPRFWSKQTPV